MTDDERIVQAAIEWHVLNSPLKGAPLDNSQRVGAMRAQMRAEAAEKLHTAVVAALSDEWWA